MWQATINKHLKTQSLTSPLFKSRKCTVDAGKMWPDCNAGLSYFNLRAGSTFFCDLLRSLMDRKPNVSASRAQPSETQANLICYGDSQQANNPWTPQQTASTLKVFRKEQHHMPKESHRFQSSLYPR